MNLWMRIKGYIFNYRKDGCIFEEINEKADTTKFIIYIDGFCSFIIRF